MRPLHLVELQGPCERLEHGLGDAGDVAALEPRVVVDADAGEHRDLLPPKPRNAPVLAVPRQPRLVGRDAARLEVRNSRISLFASTAPAYACRPGAERDCRYLDQQGRSRGVDVAWFSRRHRAAGPIRQKESAMQKRTLGTATSRSRRSASAAWA